MKNIKTEPILQGTVDLSFTAHPIVLAYNNNRASSSEDIFSLDPVTKQNGCHANAMRSTTVST